MPNVFVRSVKQISQTDEVPGTTLAAFFARVFSFLRARSSERRLRLCETLSLGEKRFLAVVEYGQERFLLAGTAQNISLLRSLDRSAETGGEATAPEAGSK